MKLETLENDALRLVIAPDLGASPTAFELRLGEAWHPIMRPTSQGTLERRQSVAFSSYTLAPYSNRIRDGRFTFRGHTYQLRPNWSGGMTIHGDVRDRGFRIARPEPSTLECHYDSRLAESTNFPFDFTLTTAYRLEASPSGAPGMTGAAPIAPGMTGATLATHLRLTNVSSEPMPAGLGIHPYFVRTLNHSTRDPVLQFQARGVYDVDELIIPSAAARAITPDLDFSCPKDAYLAPIDRIYNGWDGRAILDWPGSGVRMVIEADPVFSHLVVFNGDPDGTLALEPVTNATDGFNLLDRGIPGTDVRVLEPRQSLQGTIWIRLEGV